MLTAAAGCSQSRAPRWVWTKADLAPRPPHSAHASQVQLRQKDSSAIDNECLFSSESQGEKSKGLPPLSPHSRYYPHPHAARDGHRPWVSGTSQPSLGGMHLEATKNNCVWGHSGSSREKNQREEVPGHGAKLSKACPEGSMASPQGWAPGLPFPPGRTNGERTAWPRLQLPLLETPMHTSRDRQTCKAAKPHAYPTPGQSLQANLQQAELPMPPLGTSDRDSGSGPAPWGRTASLAHQLVPWHTAEEGVGLQFRYATSSRAQTPLRVVL